MKSEWIAALAESLRDGADTVPAGWKTVREIAKEMGRSYSYSATVIRSLVDSGRAECRTFRVVAGRAGLRAVPHYRVKK